MRTAVERLPWYRFLARPPLPGPDEAQLGFLRGRSILVTGAGGSIGSTLALKLASLEPETLILLEASENNLHALEAELSETSLEKTAISFLGSTGDEALLDDIFAQHRPDWIFHAAAHKHVSLLESHPLAAIHNNVLGTLAISSRARACGGRVVLVSTDKAASPLSAMGATKRVAELIVLANGGTALRLGNVLGSRGSAAEVFAGQISRGRPVTVTHPEARRYFVALEEAAPLLLAAALETGPVATGHASPSRLFAADLARTHAVRELAAFVAHELAPDRELVIQTTGLRAGEKMSEVLWSEDEIPGEDVRYGLRTIETPQPPKFQLDSELERLSQAVKSRRAHVAIAVLEALVPGYQPSQHVLAAAESSSCKALAT